MAIALGLDAGGTYTDAVLYDLESHEILASAKAGTTPPTYVEGISDAVDRLPADLRSTASYAALSTTLATNAIVEGRHAPAGLLLIGYDQYEARSVNWSPKCVVPGRHTIRGAETEPLDESALVRALDELLEEGVAGIAISSVMSTRNPDHELRALEIVQRRTDMPFVAGHRVAGVLNSLVRAETAALNAGLIPIIHRFIGAVESALADAGMGGVPTFMVTGDGSLMSSDLARQRPVETILSGPACSVLGAARLAGIPDGVVADIGGTTTDVAVLAGGAPRMAPGGVAVGPWRAGVRSARVITRGLGGDSAITVTPRIAVGPGRVVPVSRLGATSEAFRESLLKLGADVKAGRPPGADWRLTNPTDAFVRLPGDLPDRLAEDERAILDALADGPLTRLALGEAVGYPHLSLLQTGRLESLGLVQRAGLTPTDLWHVTGSFAEWDVDTARAAVELAARRSERSVDALVERVNEIVAQALTRQIAQSHLGIEGEDDGCDAGTLSGALARIALRETPSNGLAASLALKPPVVGAGAPAALFLRPVVERLGADLVIPEGAEVANAVGAAVGAVTVVSEALIRPQEDGSVLCYAPNERAEFDERDEAVAWAGEQLMPVLDSELTRRGARTASIQLTVEHRGAEVFDSPEPIWWETAVTARGVGSPTGRGEADPKDRPNVESQTVWDSGLREAEERRGEQEPTL